MTDEEFRARLDQIEKQVKKVNNWLFEKDPGDKETRAELIMETCRDWRGARAMGRTAVRVVVACLGLAGGWFAGVGDAIAKLLSR